VKSDENKHADRGRKKQQKGESPSGNSKKLFAPWDDRQREEEKRASAREKSGKYLSSCQPARDEKAWTPGVSEQKASRGKKGAGGKRGL